MTRDVVCPVVHLNGTGREELIRVRENAYAQLREAFEELKRMAPNGRDYYPVPGLMDRALAQHNRRLAAVGELMDELDAELEGLGNE